MLIHSYLGSLDLVMELGGDASEHQDFLCVLKKDFFFNQTQDGLPIIDFINEDKTELGVLDVCFKKYKRRYNLSVVSYVV